VARFVPGIHLKPMISPEDGPRGAHRGGMSANLTCARSTSLRRGGGRIVLQTARGTAGALNISGR